MQRNPIGVPYVHFSELEEWLEDLGNSGTKEPVRLCWNMRPDPHMPVMVHRTLTAGFIDPYGRLVEVTSYFGDTLTEQTDPTKFEKAKQMMTSLEQQISQLGHEVRSGRYRLDQAGG